MHHIGEHDITIVAGAEHLLGITERCPPVGSTYSWIHISTDSINTPLLSQLTAPVTVERNRGQLAKKFVVSTALKIFQKFGQHLLRETGISV